MRAGGEARLLGSGAGSSVLRGRAAGRGGVGAADAAISGRPPSAAAAAPAAGREARHGAAAAAAGAAAGAAAVAATSTAASARRRRGKAPSPVEGGHGRGRGRGRGLAAVRDVARLAAGRTGITGQQRALHDDEPLQGTPMRQLRTRRHLQGAGCQRVRSRRRPAASAWMMLGAQAGRLRGAVLVPSACAVWEGCGR
jgi:hypothetical protein